MNTLNSSAVTIDHAANDAGWKTTVDLLNQSVSNLPLSATHSPRGIVLLFSRPSDRGVKCDTSTFGYVHLSMASDTALPDLFGARADLSECVSPESMFATLQGILLRHFRSGLDLSDRFTCLIATAICILADRYQWCSSAQRRSGVSGLMLWQEERAKSYLEDHIGEPLAMEEVARLFGMSTQHFSKRFKRSTGLPPYRWLLKRRIEWAKELLRTSSETLADVSLECGFTEQSHFTNKFRKEVGMTPGAWRHAHRQK